MTRKVTSKRLPGEYNKVEVEKVLDIKEPEVKPEVDTIELMKMINELKEKINSMEAEKPKDKNIPVSNEEKINSDDYIKVMSLNPYELNLTTERNGRGKIFSFKDFGEVKNILYGDLVLIIETHGSFLNQGRFVILDRRVIRRHGLDESYGKLLTKENFEAILDGRLSNNSSGNQSDAVKLFEGANDVQREAVSRIFVDKILAGEDVDLNFLYRLKRIIGYSIVEKAEGIRKTIEDSKEENA